MSYCMFFFFLLIAATACFPSPHYSCSPKSLGHMWQRSSWKRETVKDDAATVLSWTTETVRYVLAGGAGQTLALYTSFQECIERPFQDWTVGSTCLWHWREQTHKTVVCNCSYLRKVPTFRALCGISFFIESPHPVPSSSRLVLMMMAMKMTLHPRYICSIGIIGCKWGKCFLSLLKEPQIYLIVFGLLQSSQVTLKDE